MTGNVLIATVGAVGVFHTLVPDHWAPIAVIARRRGWSVLRTGRVGALAGCGHVASTLVLGGIVWLGGMTVAAAYGHAVTVAAAVGLMTFGLWIAYGGWKETRTQEHEHEHESGERLDARDDDRRAAILLLLGSSPMVEGLPAFLAASTKGVLLLLEMALVFGIATVATYVVTCVFGAAGLRRLSLGPFERYGEVVSGSIVALVGVYSLVTA